MRRHYAEIQSRGGIVVAVSFEARTRLFQLSRQMQLPFVVLSDPERDVYRAYGLSRGALSQAFGWGTIWAYAKLLVRGRWYHFRQSDLRQRGGDFVLDAAGVVRYEHRGVAPHHRPPVEGYWRCWTGAEASAVVAVLAELVIAENAGLPPLEHVNDEPIAGETHGVY